MLSTRTCRLGSASSPITARLTMMIGTPASLHFLTAATMAPPSRAPQRIASQPCAIRSSICWFCLFASPSQRR